MPETTMYTQQTLPALIGGGIVTLIIILAVREMVWKGIALWKAGTKKQIAWFVCLFIFNTAGILPILYLIFRQKKEK